MVTGASGLRQADTCSGPLETCINLHIFIFHEETHDTEHGKAALDWILNSGFFYQATGSGPNRKTSLAEAFSLDAFAVVLCATLRRLVCIVSVIGF